MRAALLSLIALSMLSSPSFAGKPRKTVKIDELDQLSASLAKPLADGLDAQIAQAQTNHRLSYASYQAAKTAIEGDGNSTGINGQLSALAEQIKAQEDAVRVADGRFLGFGSKSADQLKQEAKLAALRAKEGDIRETLTAWQSKLGESARQSNEYAAATQAAQSKRDALPGKVEEDMKRMKKAVLDLGTGANLATALNAMQSKLVDLSELDKKLALLEQTYDNQVLGGYVREKLDRLVNSDAICDASKQCGSDKKDRKKVNVDYLFHNENGNLGQKRGGGVSEDTH